MRDLFRDTFMPKFRLFLMIAYVAGWCASRFLGEIDFTTTLKVGFVVGAIVFCCSLLKVFNR